MTDGTKLNNPNDPLGRAEANTRELFSALGKVCSGFPHEAVLGAAGNLLINSIRQAHAHRKGAADAFDELAYQLKAALMEHYSESGTRKNVFPYTQHLTAELFKSKQRY